MSHDQDVKARRLAEKLANPQIGDRFLDYEGLLITIVATTKDDICAQFTISGVDYLFANSKSNWARYAVINGYRLADTEGRP